MISVRHAEQHSEAGRAKEMKKYLIVIEETGTGYSAYSPDLDGCVATGKTREQVEQEMREAIGLSPRWHGPKRRTNSRAAYVFNLRRGPSPGPLMPRLLRGGYLAFNPCESA